MNKKSKIIILSVLILVLIVAGYLLYNKWWESKMGLVSFENVQEQTVNGIKYIENKEVGLRFAIPEGWEVSKEKLGLSMHSPNFVSFDGDLFFMPKKGCWFEISAKIQKEGSGYDLNYSYLKDEISTNYCSQYQNDEQKLCEMEKVSDLKGIRENNFKNDGGNPGSTTNLRIPYNNIIYSFDSYFFGENKETCLWEFNNLLTTVTIKK